MNDANFVHNFLHSSTRNPSPLGHISWQDTQASLRRSLSATLIVWSRCLVRSNRMSFPMWTRKHSGNMSFRRITFWCSFLCQSLRSFILVVERTIDKRIAPSVQTTRSVVTDLNWEFSSKSSLATDIFEWITAWKLQVKTCSTEKSMGVLVLQCLDGWVRRVFALVSREVVMLSRSAR